MTDALPPPEVSVLVPCWNAAATIERALGSVLEQREVPVEVVVVDDASTDGSAEIVAGIAAHDPRVVLVRAPANEGVSAARNRGLREVRGEWLTFLDADDRLLPGALSALHGAAGRTDALVVVGQRIWSDGERTWMTKTYDRPDIREPGRKSLVRNPGLLYFAAGHAKLVHRSCRQDLWFEGRVLGDQPWTIRAMLRAGDRIEVIGDVVYEWTRPGPDDEPGGITAAKHESARVAAEAAVVARGALRQVAEEADRVLAEPGDRRTVVAAYFDRLASSDFAGPVARAIARGDEGTGRLFEAIGEFLASAPPDIVAGSTALVDRVLRPPLLHWHRVRPDARRAYWAMLRPFLATRSPLTRRLAGRRRLLLPVMRLAAAGDSAAARALAGAALWAASITGSLRSRWMARRG